MDNKVYDGTTAATTHFTAATLRGVLASDAANVTLVTTAGIGRFADKVVGRAKPVTLSGITPGSKASAGCYKSS